MEYEGRRCLWRVALGGIVMIPVLAIGGFVAGIYIAGDPPQVARAALGAVVAIGAGQVAVGYLWRQRLWDRLIVDRILTYETIDGPSDLSAMIRREDFVAACHALRRAKLNPTGGTLVPPLNDAPELNLKLIVGRSARWHPSDAPEIFVQIADCLREAKIRARVAGEDINR
jgi:hypothetical protein